jgi:hypothetical protein
MAYPGCELRGGTLLPSLLPWKQKKRQLRALFCVVPARGRATRGAHQEFFFFRTAISAALRNSTMRSAASGLLVRALAARTLACSTASTSATATASAAAAAAAPFSRRALHASPPARDNSAPAKATTGIVGLAVDPAARTTALAKLRAVVEAMDAAGVPEDAQYRKGVDGLVAQRCVGFCFVLDGGGKGWRRARGSVCRGAWSSSGGRASGRSAGVRPGCGSNCAGASGARGSARPPLCGGQSTAAAPLPPTPAGALCEGTRRPPTQPWRGCGGETPPTGLRVLLFSLGGAATLAPLPFSPPSHPRLSQQHTTQPRHPAVRRH